MFSVKVKDNFGSTESNCETLQIPTFEEGKHEQVFLCGM